MLKYILLFLGVVLSPFCMAQTVSQVVDVVVAKELQLDSAQNGNLFDMTPEEIDSLYTINPAILLASFELSDSNNIDSVYIQVGRTANATDVLDLQLAWIDVNNSPLFIEKSAQSLILRLGAFINTNQLYLRCWIRNAQGNLSNIFTSTY